MNENGWDYDELGCPECEEVVFIEKDIDEPLEDDNVWMAFIRSPCSHYI